MTDASKLNGLGYVLMQSSSSPTSPETIIQCGSRSLTQHEQNYATIELECMAMAWAAGKWDYYLHGCPHFNIVTDHCPLLGIFSKPLSEISNPRIVLMQEKLLSYQFSVTWLSGKTNAITDALSRNPIDPGTDDKMFTLRSYVVGASRIVEDLKNGSTNCQHYKLIKEALRQGKLIKNLPPSHPDKGLNNVWDKLTISDDNLILLDTSRIFVPKPCQRRIIQLLHKSHCEITKTLALARKFYFWPSLKNDISNAINSCEQCQYLRPSLPTNIEVNTTARKPMEKVSVDLFEIKNKHYILLVDRFSGLPWFKTLQNLSTKNYNQFNIYLSISKYKGS